MTSLPGPSSALQALIQSLREELYASLERDATESLKILSPMLINVLQQAELEKCRREDVLGPEISVFATECSKSEEHTTRYLVHHTGPFDFSFLSKITPPTTEASRKRSNAESPDQAKKKSKSDHVDQEDDGKTEAFGDEEVGNGDQASLDIEPLDNNGNTIGGQAPYSAYEQYREEEGDSPMFYDGLDEGGGDKTGEDVPMSDLELDDVEPDVSVDELATTPEVSPAVGVATSTNATTPEVGPAVGVATSTNATTPEVGPAVGVATSTNATTPEVSPAVECPLSTGVLHPQAAKERHGYRLVVPRPSRNIPNLPPLMEVFKAQTGLSTGDALKELFGPNKLSWYASRDLDLFELEGDARCARCSESSKRCFRIIGNNCLRCAKSHLTCTVKDMPAPETYINDIESTEWKPSPPDNASSTTTRSSTPSTNPGVPAVAIQKPKGVSSTTRLMVRIPPSTRSTSRTSSRVSSRQSSAVPKSDGDVPKSGLGPRFILDAHASSSRQVSPADGQTVVANSNETSIPSPLAPTPLPDTTPFLSLVGDLTNTTRQLRAKQDSLAYRVQASKDLQRKIHHKWQEQVETTVESRLKVLEEWKRDAKMELEAFVASKLAGAPPPSIDTISGLHALVSTLVEKQVVSQIKDGYTQPPPLQEIPGLESLVSRLVDDRVQTQIENIHIPDIPNLQGLVSRVVDERLQEVLGVLGDRQSLLKELEIRLENAVTTSIQQYLDKSEFQERVDQQMWKRMEARVAESIQGGLEKAMPDVVRRDGSFGAIKDVEERLQKEIDGLMGTSWRAIKHSDAVRDDLNKFKVSSGSCTKALSQRVEELHTEVTNLRPLTLNLVEALTKFVGGVGNTLQGPALAALTNPLNQPGPSNPPTMTHQPQTPPKDSSTATFDYLRLFSPPNAGVSGMAETTYPPPSSEVTEGQASADQSVPPWRESNTSGTWDWQEMGGSSGGVVLDDSFGADFGFHDSPSHGSSRSESSQFHFSGRGGKF